MAMPLNSETFDKMVDEDIAWLKEQGIDIEAPENSLYGGHIVACLKMAKKYYREVELPNTPESAWDC
ncbi:hypothetical protein [Spongiibacter marinus]|uniref:hypothetical protein n=1 Tax=Spongiibacter marinus TaxID=354246 RepID=UPI001961EB10|nr:hypothetical protein [Spongiibacter marinus]MBM7424939.1 hypothetical protein [Spongiibacter marinus]